ncbi:MAG: UDP-glucose 4-epimerase GalE [Acidobacteria bacterium]|nr:UDP-glucose 4-epimerase GalE [Acidobacteriota bacterium]
MASSTSASAAKTGAVLVTGGAGYIGSHAAKALAAAGRRVVVIDNLSTGHRAAVRWGDMVVADVHDVPRVRETIRQYGVSAVMHFAASSLVGESVRNPISYYLNNVGGALALLEAMVEESVTRLVFSSTAAVFGDPIETPITENHPTHPINAYGETKLAVERALVHFERAYGIRSVSLRYFNAAGADPEGDLGEDHQPETHLIPRAVEAALGGSALQVFGADYQTPDGTCLRDYVHVCDLSRAHLLALEHLEHNGGTRIYNLGIGTPFSVQDVISSVERASGRPVPAERAARRPGDPAVLFASSDRIRTELGWRPAFVGLDAIVESAWAWRLTHPHGYQEEAVR